MAKHPTFPIIYENQTILELKTLIGWGCLAQYGQCRSTLVWRCRGEKTAEVGVLVYNSSDERYLQLSYNYCGEQRTYRISIESRPSNLGKGVVWYFRCPATQQLCRKLYLHDGWFVSRKAVPGCYEVQALSKRDRLTKRVYNSFFQQDDVNEDLYKRYAKQTYRGKSTVRSQRLLKKLERMDETLKHNYRKLLDA